MVMPKGGCLLNNNGKESAMRPLKPIARKLATAVELPILHNVGSPNKTEKQFSDDAHMNRSTNEWNCLGLSSECGMNQLRRQGRRVHFVLPSQDVPSRSVAVMGGGNERARQEQVNKSKSAAGGQQPRASFSHAFGGRRNYSYSRQRRRAESRETREKRTSTLTSFSLASRKKRAAPATPERTTYPRLHICTSVLVTTSPAVRRRVPPSGRYSNGTLSPTAQTVPRALPLPTEQALLRAARDSDDALLRELLRNVVAEGFKGANVNAIDSSGRTVLSYIASNGSIDLLELILQLPGLDSNKADNEGNTPLHFAAQAGQIECLNCMLSRCRGIEIDARNNLGFTPLMKAAIQGRNKCAKLLLFAGANPTLRDSGRGFRADQWARFCGRYVCADVIEKHARQRLLERSTSMGNWGTENDVGAKIIMGKGDPGAASTAAATGAQNTPQQSSHGLKSKLRKVFRTSSSPQDRTSSTRLVTQLTTAALCASSPVLPSGPVASPVIKTLTRPLSVPRLQVTLANSHGGIDISNNNNSIGDSKPPSPEKSVEKTMEENGVVKPLRTKKKK